MLNEPDDNLLLLLKIIMTIYYISLTIILPQSDLHNDNPRGPRLPLPSGGPDTLSVPLPSPSVTLAPALLSPGS